MKFVYILTSALILAHCNSPKKDSTNASENPQKPTDPKPTLDPSKTTIAKMALLGDSIGVGFLSDTKFGQAPLLLSPAIEFLLKLQGGTQPFDALRENLGTRYRTQYPSAFIGKLTEKDCFSLACKLGRNDSNAQNLAVAGDRIANVLSTQLPALAADTDFVISEIGANDFCDPHYDETTFLTHYKKLLDELSISGNKTVLVIPIPKIPSVFKNAPSGTFNISIVLGTIPEDLTCGDFRDGQRFGSQSEFCPRLLAHPNSHLAKEWTDLNHKLKTLVSSYDSKKFFFADQVTSWNIEQKDLAVDCFHPNLSAHQKLAEISWDAVKDHIQGSH